MTKTTNKDLGFSLLELVVAVGILLVLTVGGLVAYNGIVENARQAEMSQLNNEPKRSSENEPAQSSENEQPGPETNKDREDREKVNEK